MSSLYVLFYRLVWKKTKGSLTSYKESSFIGYVLKYFFNISAYIIHIKHSIKTNGSFLSDGEQPAQSDMMDFNVNK